MRLRLVVIVALVCAAVRVDAQTARISGTVKDAADRPLASVGTLYQYFPNKHSLLFSVLEQHLNRVANAVERVCRQNRGERRQD